MMRQKKINILIIGLSSDIGIQLLKSLKIAKWLNVENNKINIIGTVNKSNNKIIKSLIIENEKNFKVNIFKVNLSINKEVDCFIERLLKKFKTPSYIIHLAAPSLSFKRFTDLSIRELNSNFNIQVRSIALILSKLIPLMKKNSYQNKILFVISSSVHKPTPKYMSSYVIAKYALLGLLDTVYAEYSKKNIDINAISPSMIDTKFLKNIPEHFKNSVASKNGNKKLLSTKNIIPDLLFYLSPESDNVSGKNFIINN